MEDTVVIKQSFFKQLFLVFLCIIMALCSVFVFLIKNNVIYWVIGIIGVLFSGISFLFTMKHLMMQKPILTINSSGFIDNSTVMSSGKMVYWSQVKEIYILSFCNQNFISVKLKNPNEFLEELNPIQKILTNVNLACSFDIIQITLNSVNTNYEEVYQTMKEYWLACQTK